MTGNDWIALFGLLGLASLVPVIWAIVDVVRRPAWQFSAGRKALWAATLGFGWLLFWPIALVSSLLYLFVIRRRFPPVTSPMSGGGHQPLGYGPQAGGGYRPYGSTAPYGGQPYGGGPEARPYVGQQGPPAYGTYDVPTGPPPTYPPAGWYPDPGGSQGQRWWDGRGWTDHLRREES